MIEQLLIIADSVLFLLLGYYLGQHTQQTQPKPTQQSTKKSVKNFLMKAGIIEYPTQADIDYVASGEEKVDAERERVFREQFKP